MLLKKNFDADRFITTTNAAKILQLSVGTVQSIVDQGHIESYRTRGGHRKISLQSLMNYCQRRNIPVPELDTYETNLGSGRIFIAPYALDEGVRLEIEKYDVEWIDTPLDFLGLNIQMECLLLDSRLPWLNINNLRMGTSQSYFRKIVLYNANSDDYEKVTDFHVCARDLSADLLEGILIGALYFRHGAANASSMGAVLGGQDMRRSAAVA